jgi:hypothetical protein
MKDSDSGRWTIELNLSHHDDGYYSVDWFKGEDETIERASNAKTEEEADAILREAYKGPDVDGVTCKWFISRNLHHPEFWSFGGHNIQATYGWGTEAEANRYLDHLNRDRENNQYEARLVSDEDAKAMHLEDEAFVIEQEIGKLKAQGQWKGPEAA